MSSATGLVLLITLATSLTVVPCSGWRWNFGWSTDVPDNCPSENHETHICSTLESLNATCIMIKCCGDFADDDETDNYDSYEESDEDDETVYSLRNPTEDVCGLCYTSNPCSVYKCYSRCCDGYEADEFGRCQNETGHLQCQNKGVLYTVYGIDTCVCTAGFRGISCEIPICQCENGGECVVKDNKPHCNCSYGHYGHDCEKSNCSMQCHNGGQCIRDGTNEFCRCPNKYAGKQCDELFTQPDTCPVPEYEHLYCSAQCTSNTDCKHEHVCCREGCTTICREPKPDHCMYRDSQFEINQSHQPDPCTTCTCMPSGRMICSSMTCSTPFCAYGGRPEQKHDQCCLSCPGTPPVNPPQIHCPSKVLYVNTNNYTDQASINSATTNIRAFNSQNIALPVKYSPPLVRHCHCHERPELVVTAFATDAAGNVATCTFKVIVLDKQPPVITSCPKGIYVFENENVQWKEPTYKDNVGVAHETSTHKMNEKFPVGIHTAVRYQIRDYDQNTAFCNFIVSVTPTDTDFADLPQGLKDRSTGSIAMAGIISGSVLGCIALLVVLLLLFCCRRQRLARTSRNTRGASSLPPAYDNNIYATVDDIAVKLPPYSKVPMNPPPYSISGSNKDVIYMTLPPTYKNPGYGTVNDAFATLNVHVPKPAKSVVSEKSVKSYEKE